MTDTLYWNNKACVSFRLLKWKWKSEELHPTLCIIESAVIVESVESVQT